MAKNTVDETEYDIEDAEHDMSAFGEIEKKNPWVEKFKTKPVYLVTGLVVILFIFYKLLTFLFTIGYPKAPIQPRVSQQQIQTKAYISSEKSEIVSKLAIIENKQLEQQNKLVEQGQALANLEVSIANLQSKIDLLNTKMQEFKNEPLHLAKKKRVKPSHVVAKKEKRPVYYVQALVPERAWLKQADGTTITVTRGDTIPGYGQVSLIDLSQGIVITTKGDSISFHPKER
ncbi:MAG: hypothetical protein LEGION0398_MBIBDBAK_00468 [Legionellaceae bacterium]